MAFVVAARTLQRSFGDFFINLDADTVRSLEIKVARHWTGNLFLETWSNLNLEDREAHAEHGSTPGWMVTSRRICSCSIFSILTTW